VSRLETTHQHHDAAEHDHGHGHDHGHEEEHGHGHGPHEDWNNEEYVDYWLDREARRGDQRRRQFVVVRAFIPKLPEQEFRYLNLGAGPGNLDEVLLAHFPGAQATLVDGSLAMLGAARNRLEQYDDRVEYVQGNLANPEWAGAVSGPFDVVVSTIALHNLRDPQRIRELYGEVFQLLGHGGVFLNLEYVRPPRPSLAALSAWAANDPEARLGGRSGGAGMPGTILEQLLWLNEAGFPCADVLWKEQHAALLLGVRDHLHMPESDHDHEGAHQH
jgi:SAM-dependent methyltransferase